MLSLYGGRGMQICPSICGGGHAKPALAGYYTVP